MHIVLRMFFRTIYWSFRSRLGAPLDVHGTSRIILRTRLGDLDTFGHMNNGAYPLLTDIGRVDLTLRSGMFQALARQGWFPVVAGATITYRRPIRPLERFVLETRIAGYDERATYIRHRFVVGDQVHAESWVKMRVLRRVGGTVSTAELARAVDIDTSSLALPAWVARWSDDSRLSVPRELSGRDGPGR
jgi:acyl-CoA thioesterase FadM